MALTIKNVACVHVTNNHRSYKIDRDKITSIATEISRRLGVAHYEICVSFVSPRAMKILNQQYRDKDKSTDVLSFPQYAWKRPLKVRKDPPATRPLLNPMPLGDVVISADDAAANALESGHELSREICFLLIHGILHLVGHDHMKPAEKKLMFAEQRKLLRVFSGSKTKKPDWTDCLTPKAVTKPVKKSGSKTTKKKPSTKRTRKPTNSKMKTRQT